MTHKGIQPKFITSLSRIFVMTQKIQL